MKIICVGLNYALHADEMGRKPPGEPVIFMKPETALLRGGGALAYPAFTKELHHEVELVLHVCREGRNVPVDEADSYYDAIGIGIDFTARDLQSSFKAKGRPWEKSKAFDGSAPVSEEWLPKSDISDIGNIPFRLEKNGEVVQHGNSKDLLFGFDTLVSHISEYFTLKPGDLIFTGTPEGVGPVIAGDRLVAYLNDRPMLNLAITA